MDLITNNYTDSRYKMSHNITKTGATVDRNPFTKKDSLSFTSANPDKIKIILDKATGILTYTNASKLISSIDEILGEKSFTKALQAAGVSAGENDKLTLQGRTFFGDLIATAKYPFVDLPRDLSIFGLNLLKKTPLKELAQKGLDSEILSKRIATKNQEKNLHYVLDILDDFAPLKKKNTTGEFLFKIREDAFKDKVTSNITKTAKNYDSRDERTLNRIVTSTVSAVYSGKDFYNISMLQKDDKEEAKKAERGRFLQEFKRMALSATTTFLTLGVLNRYVQGNVVANSAVIALSALFSEVGSRILSGTPLIPLSPEQAAKIGEKNKNKNTTQTKTDKPQEAQQNNSQVAFKNNILTNNVFKQFASQDGTFTSLKTLTEENAKEATKNKAGSQPQKKSGLKKVLMLAFGGCSLAFFTTRILKGDYKFKAEAQKAFKNFNKKDLEKYTLGELPIEGGLLEKVKTLISLEKTSKKGPVSNIYNNICETGEKVKDFIIKKPAEEFPLEEVSKHLEHLKQISPENAHLFEKYQDHVNILLNAGNSTLKCKSPRMVSKGVYEGVGRIFKTLYTIFSTPAWAIDKLFFGKGQNIYEGLSKKVNEGTANSYKKEIIQLWEMLPKKISTLTEEQQKTAYEKSAKEILKNIRNFTKGSETGELANISRTMVTAISTYFFVNDYTNKVLIESGGKATEEAKEERNERIAHKISNFIINGTLMNIFNSVFKTQLNNSLPQAAVIAGVTEATNEFLVRKSICQPVTHMDSKQEIIDYETKQMNQKGPMGSWSRLFKKITGKKSLTQKAGIEIKTENQNK